VVETEESGKLTSAVLTLFITVVQAHPRRISEEKTA
jgi:hypothetical protein